MVGVPTIPPLSLPSTKGVVEEEGREGKNSCGALWTAIKGVVLTKGMSSCMELWYGRMRPLLSQATAGGVEEEDTGVMSNCGELWVGTVNPLLSLIANGTAVGIGAICC